MGQRLWECGYSSLDKAVASTIPVAGWRDYVQWCLGRRRRFRVRENSMVPTLMPGDTVLVEMGAAVRVGDIAIATSNTPNQLLIKRVNDIFYDGGIFLISDNANEPSVRDSRHFGVVSANRIIGRVTSRLASVSE